LFWAGARHPELGSVKPIQGLRAEKVFIMSPRLTGTTLGGVQETVEAKPHTRRTVETYGIRERWAASR
jgi:hypothetical protein